MLQNWFSFINISAYRIPMQVKEIRLFASGCSYPVCPRCNRTLDREYMSFCDRCGQSLAWTFLEHAVTRHVTK